jgi:hypothetical protein
LAVIRHNRKQAAAFLARKNAAVRIRTSRRLRLDAPLRDEPRSTGVISTVRIDLVKIGLLPSQPQWAIDRQEDNGA